MARAWRKNKLAQRRKVALAGLRKRKFTEKTRSNGVPRTQEDWQATVAAEIAILEKRIGISS